MIALEPSWAEPNFIPMLSRAMVPVYQATRVEPFMREDILSRALASVLASVEDAGCVSRFVVNWQSALTNDRFRYGKNSD